MIKQTILSLLFCFLSIVGFTQKEDLITEDADKISTRFDTPLDYERISYPEDSFGTYLRGLKLKDMGSPILYYDGRRKSTLYHISVIDLPILSRDLIQCADAVIKLRAEYFYNRKEYDFKSASDFKKRPANPCA